MKRHIIIPAILLSVAASIQAQDYKMPDNEDLVITHGPYLQNLTGTGATIMWSTNRQAVPGVWLTIPGGEKKLVRNSHDGIIDALGTHAVTINGLEPGKEYRYRISSVQVLKYQGYRVYYGDTLTSGEITFVTPPDTEGKLRFTMINDVHGNSRKLASYLKTGSLFNPAFYIFNGDMVDYLQDEDQLYPAFVDTAVSYFARSKPFIYVRGNHETRGYAARDLKNKFCYDRDKYYFTFTRGNIHFTVLDCGEDKPDNNRYYYDLADYDNYRLEQLEWLKEVVKSKSFLNAGRRIVIIHMPVFSNERNGHGMSFLASSFGPVLREAGIDLMLSAHLHRTMFMEKEKTGFGYPLLINSNNSYVEIEAGDKSLKAVVKDPTGNVISTYEVR